MPSGAVQPKPTADKVCIGTKTRQSIEHVTKCAYLQVREDSDDDQSRVLNK